jgi:hypothetical protein
VDVELKMFERRQGFGREDFDCYCPRVDQQVLIISGTCYCPKRNKILCNACIYDLNVAVVKLLLLLVENLSTRAKDGSQPRTEMFSEERKDFHG